MEAEGEWVVEACMPADMHPPPRESGEGDSGLKPQGRLELQV